MKSPLPKIAYEHASYQFNMKKIAYEHASYQFNMKTWCPLGLWICVQCSKLPRLWVYNHASFFRKITRRRKELSNIVLAHKFLIESLSKEGPLVVGIVDNSIGVVE